MDCGKLVICPGSHERLHSPGCWSEGTRSCSCVRNPSARLPCFCKYCDQDISQRGWRPVRLERNGRSFRRDTMAKILSSCGSKPYDLTCSTIEIGRESRPHNRSCGRQFGDARPIFEVGYSHARHCRPFIGDESAKSDPPSAFSSKKIRFLVRVVPCRTHGGRNPTYRTQEVFDRLDRVDQLLASEVFPERSRTSTINAP